MEDKSKILDNLAYFTEWGGRGWNRLLSSALTEFLGQDLSGKRILEIGSRYGKLSCLFALLGAEVVGIDIAEHTIETAKVEALKWNVSENTEFLAYNGNLDSLDIGSFDIVFTKSVLVVVPQLQDYLLSINRILARQGQVVFLENAWGNSVLHFLRRYRHQRWDYQTANYFTQDHVDLISNIFNITQVKKNALPPIILVAGYKK